MSLVSNIVSSIIGNLVSDTDGSYKQGVSDSVSTLVDDVGSWKIKGSDKSLSQAVNDAKSALKGYIPSVFDVLSPFLGGAASNILSGLDSNNGSSESPGSSGNGGSYGALGTGSVGSGYDSYLDMLHSEQERVWAREDTYYQRAVKDMQAAGLNPVLAAGHGVSGGGSSASSDSQVVGAVADLAAMAISGLTETAKGIGSLSALSNNSSFWQKAGSWYKSNAKTIQTGVSTAAGLAKLAAIIAA